MTFLKSFLAFMTVVLVLYSANAEPIPYPAAGNHTLSIRADRCSDGTYKEPPCICNNKLGLRRKTLLCPTDYQVVYKNTDPRDGEVEKEDGTAGVGHQCADHYVELQFIKQQITKTSGLCDFLLADLTKYGQFFDTINDGTGLRYLQEEVNQAKGKLFAHNTMKETDAKAASGVASYLNLVNQDLLNSANRINNKMNELVHNTNQGGFSRFVLDWEDEWRSVAADATKQAKNLPDAVPKTCIPGTIFIPWCPPQ
ncbi:hypothetical protein PM082_024685 [Marasmius tenuissimus]|nr:hypothetical protein PM082_024685 [Marasmius tenuissimus]